MKNKKLRLSCLAIGSLPHKTVNEAMSIVKKEFSSIPFWPQLAKFNRREDMIFQFLEAFPGVVDNGEKIYLDNESDEFFEDLESFFMDYEEIISSEESELLVKYAISIENSSTIPDFLKTIEETRPAYAKGQIVGPFTLATSLTDKEGRCAYYDETLREVIVKALSLKALWQIAEIKKASPDTTPIIFIDEPSISQLGTSAFITISKEEVIDILTEVSEIIKNAGGLSAIHCCGKCDWSIPIESNIDIINLDGFFFAQNLSLFAKEVDEYLKNGGLIAWGIVPTLDKEALEGATIDSMLEKFEEALGYLVNKGVDKDLLINQSLVTPSCGAGSLSIELAEKAMNLTSSLSKILMEKYEA